MLLYTKSLKVELEGKLFSHKCLFCQSTPHCLMGVDMLCLLEAILTCFPIGLGLIHQSLVTGMGPSFPRTFTHQAAMFTSSPVCITFTIGKGGRRYWMFAFCRLSQNSGKT